VKATSSTINAILPGFGTEKLLWAGGRLLRLIPSHTRIRVPFGINRGRLWLRGSANAPEWLGIYEHRKQRILPSIVKLGETVCDIGANAGFYTLALSRLVGSDGHVIAFEPFPANLDKIRRHLDLNKIENVTVTGCALCDRIGSVPFAAGDSDFTGRISSASFNTIEVPAITLDEFISQNRIVDPSFLKIDVEGAEANVLAGARKLIERAHPKMMIALHGQDAASGCYSILRETGYTVTALDGAKIDNAETIPSEVLAVYSPLRSK
jgi:FkbM family methyltransferase